MGFCMQGVVRVMLDLAGRGQPRYSHFWKYEQGTVLNQQPFGQLDLIRRYEKSRGLKPLVGGSKGTSVGEVRAWGLPLAIGDSGTAASRGTTGPLAGNCWPWQAQLWRWLCTEELVRTQRDGGDATL